jgi:hypothetical protein
MIAEVKDGKHKGKTRATEIEILKSEPSISKKEVVTPASPSKPLVQWTPEEVQQWLASSDDFKEYATQFSLSGKALAGLTEAQFQKELGNIKGSALYNAVLELKKRDGTL